MLLLLTTGGSENRGRDEEPGMLPERLFHRWLTSAVIFASCRARSRQRSQRRRDSKQKAEEQQSEANSGSPEKEVQPMGPLDCTFHVTGPGMIQRFGSSPRVIVNLNLTQVN